MSTANFTATGVLEGREDSAGFEKQYFGSFVNVMQSGNANSMGQEDSARAAIKARVREAFMHVLKSEDVENDRDFFHIGGTHHVAPGMMAGLSKALGVELTVKELDQARSVDKLTDLVYFEQRRIDLSTVVPLRNAQGTKPPLFFVHGVGGNVLGFYALAKCLNEDQPVYGIQAQALLPGREAKLRLVDMAAQYVADMRAVWPKGPYHLLGFSFGGLVAFEIAQQLKAAGLEVGLVGMLDTRQPEQMRGVKTQGPLHSRLYTRARLAYMRTSRRKGKLKYLWQRVNARMQRASYQVAAKTGVGQVATAVRDVREINFAAGVSYVLQAFAGKVTLFKAEPVPGEMPLPEDLFWGRVAEGGVDIRHLPGDHGRILYEPGLSALAHGLTAELAAFEEKHGGSSGRVEMEF